VERVDADRHHADAARGAAVVNDRLAQFAGPVVLGLWVEHFGWHAAPSIVVPAALLGLASAFVLRRVLDTSG